MSIYRRKDLINLNDVHHTPRRNMQGPLSSRDEHAASHDWSKVRRANPADYLLPVGDDWFDRLPPQVQPCALITYYPRIANLIALQWNNQSACTAYFDELLIDRRGSRQGFPAAVKRDLVALRDYWWNRQLRREE